jgi:RNA polymerase sigma-70 factor (ECF subfamily)
VTHAVPAHRASRDETFEVEALPWVDDVHRFALSLTRNAADADDILQDTFLRAYKSWHTYLPGSDCRRWLFTICRNAFLRSRERQSQSEEMAGLDWEREALAASVNTAFQDAARDALDDLFTRLDLGQAIERALASVPEPFQSTLRLVDVQDQSYETAAEVLGVPIGTVRSRLFRGRRLMQDRLLVHARDAGYGRMTVAVA